MDNFALVSLLGPLYIIIGIPLLLKWIPPNYVYGLRIPKTMADLNTWYTTNKRLGRNCVISGLVILLMATFAYYFSPLFLIKEKIVIILIITSVLAILISTVDCLIFLRKK